MDQVFGNCCDELNTALTEPQNSFFRVEESNGVFYLTVGYVESEEGIGYYDSAVLYCPFCGTKLQDADEVHRTTEELN